MKTWIYCVAASALLTAMVATLTPEGRCKRVVAMVCGFMMLVAVLGPIRAFDYAALGRNLVRLREDAADFAAPLDEVNENLTKRIIQERYAAYIADKGTARGIASLEVAVEVEKSPDGYWYPVRVALKTQADSAARNALAYDIESALGVSPSELTWEREDYDIGG